MMIIRAKYQIQLTCKNVTFCTQAFQIPSFKNEQSCNDYISSLYKQKLFRAVLKVFDFIEQNTSFSIYPSTYAHLISSCSSLRYLEHGRKIHKHIKSSRCQDNVILQNHVLNMYGKCGSPMDARKVFDEMTERNAVSWTSFIAGCSQNGQEVEAINVYFEMRQAGIVPDQYTHGSIIKACSGLDEVLLGKQFHGYVIKSEHSSHLIAQNALINMYSKFGLVDEAQDVFSRIKSKDLISWSSMIAGFSQLGYELEALFHFKEMLQQTTYRPNEFVFGSVLTACGRLMQPKCGRQIHGLSIKSGFWGDAYCGCALTDMYAKYGQLDAAEASFLLIENPDIVSWNAFITGLSYGSDPLRVMSMFTQMRLQGLKPDEVTLRSLLCAFTSSLYLFQGKQLHSYILKSGFDMHVTVCNTLLSMYGNCSDVPDAFKIFDEIQSFADLVSWNAVLTVCLQNDQAEGVFSLLKLMLLSPNKPDHVSVVTLLGACGKGTSLEMGFQIHCYALKTALDEDLSVVNGLIDMYVKCGSLKNAKQLFDFMENPDDISWTSLIVGYAQFGYGVEALEIFQRMITSGTSPNHVTFVGVLTACSHVGLVKEGWHFFNTMETQHGIAPRKEHYACIVDMLARVGCINEAEAFIYKMPFAPDVVVWKALLAACRTRKNVEVGKRAAESILKLDPFNSSAHVLLSGIYASTGRWKDFALLRNSMRQKSVKKVPGQSWIELKDMMHVFTASDDSHPDRAKVCMRLEELLLQMADDAYIPSQLEEHIL